MEASNSMVAQHEHTLNPVTAIDFYVCPNGEQVLLVGEGVYLKVYNPEKSELIAQCKVFEEQAIQGLVARHGPMRQIILWGGKSLVSIEDPEEIISGQTTSVSSREVSAPDWVMDVVMNRLPDSDDFILVTAHNSLLRGTKSSLDGLVYLTQISPPSRSILYSAHLDWTTPGTITVASGTVFGEIIVWQYSFNNNEIATLFTLSGHEGSIFGVQISPILSGADGMKSRLLASCSDDRTIRIWDIHEIDHPPEVIRTLYKNSIGNVPRETGFGGTVEDEQKIESARRCLAVEMGHQSRIWKVKFLSSVYCEGSQSRNTNIISFGEDATCQQWVLTTERRQDTNGWLIKHSLVHAKTYDYHSGKHIWAASIRQKGSGPHYCVTGGSDGKVSLYDVPTLVRDAASQLKPISGNGAGNGLDLEISWELGDIFMAASKGDVPGMSEAVGFKAVNSDPKSRQQKDGLNRYAFPAPGKLLLTTNAGRVILGTISHTVTWKELQLPDSQASSLRSYSILAALPEQGVAFLAGASGSVFLFRSSNNEISEIARVESKPADLFVLPISTETPSHVQLLITMLGKTTAYLLHLADVNSPEPLITSDTMIKLQAGFVVTSMGMCKERVFLGARDGRVAAYNLNTSLSPITMFAPQRGVKADAVTSIMQLPPSTPDQKQTHVLTTSRNGMFSIYSLTSDPNSATQSMTLTPLHNSTPPFGPLIEAAWLDPSSQSLSLYGFRSKSFVVYNATTDQVITDVDCGGAHRSYTYMPSLPTGTSPSTSQSSSQVTRTPSYFAYTKASKLYLHSQSSPSHNIVKTGGHGREIKACAVSPLLPSLTSDEKYQLIATGAEDTCIRLWRYYTPTASRLDGGFKCLATIQKHSAGIQHLSFHIQKAASGENVLYLMSSGGNEEFFIFRLTPNLPIVGLGVLCIGTCPPPNPEVRDLRIMSFDVLSIPASEAPAPRKAEPAENADPVISLLAEKASGDSEPKELMQAVADGKASGEQLKMFQAEIDQLRTEATQQPAPATVEDKEAFWITMAMSDSTLRSYSFTCASSEFVPVAEGRYTSHCLTHLSYITPSFNNLRDTIALTASTDGCLQIFEYPRDELIGPDATYTSSNSTVPLSIPTTKWKTGCKIPLHRNAIKSVALHNYHQDMAYYSGRWHNQTLYAIVTGGDDGALGIVLLKTSTNEKFGLGITVKHTKLFPLIHSSAITGVQILGFEGVGKEPPANFERFRVVTSGNDQRIKVHDLRFLRIEHMVLNGKGVKWKMQATNVANIFTPVADLGGLALLPGLKETQMIQGCESKAKKSQKEKVLAVGVGMEVWDMEC